MSRFLGSVEEKIEEIASLPSMTNVRKNKKDQRKIHPHPHRVSPGVLNQCDDVA
jgi:hypothetical protein